MPPKAVLFDLDGTLIDTAPDFVTSLNQLLKEEGRPPIRSEQIREQVSAGAKALVAMAFELDIASNEAEILRERFLPLYEAAISTDSVLFEGLEQLLHRLESAHIPWGIVTNKPLYLAEKLLKALSLDTRCQTLICPDHVKARKPDPESLYMACNAINVNPAECIYVGDHERDIAAGLNAGMKTITALYGYIPPGDDPALWKADYSVEKASEVELILFPEN